METGKEEKTEQQRHSAEFMFAEFQYLTTSFWRNEELGDRRVNLFLALTTAVIAASVAAATKGSDNTSTTISLLICGGLLAVLLFGIFTLKRIIRRNLDTDDYKRSADRVRKYFVERDANIGPYLPFDPYEGLKPRETKILALGNGGLERTVALLNSFIAASLVGLITEIGFDIMSPKSSSSAFSLWRIALIAVVMFVSGFIAWGLQISLVKNYYENSE